MFTLLNGLLNYDKKGKYGYSKRQSDSIERLLNKNSKMFYESKKEIVKSKKISTLLLIAWMPLSIFLFIYLMVPVNEYELIYGKEDDQYVYLNILSKGLYKINNHFDITSISATFAALLLPIIGFILLIVSYIYGLKPLNNEKLRRYIFFDKFNELHNTKTNKLGFLLNSIKKIIGLVLIVGYVFLFYIVFYPPNFHEWISPYFNAKVKIDYIASSVPNHSFEIWHIYFKLPISILIICILLIIFSVTYFAISLNSWNKLNESLVDSMMLSIRKNNGLDKITDISDDVKGLIKLIIEDNQKSIKSLI